MSFWSEIKRRNVFKVAVAYLIVAWLIVQVVSIAFPAFHMPTWTVTFVMSLLIVGFPVVLIFAWSFEITPEGLKLTKDVPHHESITHLTGKKLNYILAGIIVLALAYILFDNYYLDKRAIQTEVASRVAELSPVAANVKEAAKTIAVLPFDNLSSDPEHEYFVLGLSEEILNTLANIPDLLVTAKTSSFAFEGENKTVQEIGPILGVANILEGSVRKAGDKLRVTAQLIRAADGFHLWSNQYDRELKDVEDILSIQGDIAENVANELKVTLGVGESLKHLGGTDNVKAYEFYLSANGNDVSPNSVLELIDKAINLDPEFALAWVKKAIAHLNYANMVSIDHVAEEQAACLSAAQRAIEIEPNLAEAYLALSRYKITRGEFVEAEINIRKASELKAEFDEDFTLIYYLAVGDFERAYKILEAIRKKDPLSKSNQSGFIMYYSLLNDRKRVEEEVERSITLFGNNPAFAQIITFSHLGSSKHISNNDIVYSGAVYDAAKKYLDSPKDALEELQQIYINDDKLSTLDLIGISLFSAYFGDPDFSMEAMERVISIDHSSLFNYWYPVMHEVRQLPRFKQLVREIGLVDYWNEFEWPDICRPLDNGDFVCD